MKHAPIKMASSDDAGNGWVGHLPMILLAHHTSPQAAIEYSPHFPLNGWTPLIPPATMEHWEEVFDSECTSAAKAVVRHIKNLKSINFSTADCLVQGARTTIVRGR
jgi:hypothetical protein